ncbi:hypothetical protein GCM10012275_30250 [Longimycelium tulufanense]|uniref:Uncharacterized protein n=1 Tax=Longimycelium tulufanense TaxID=907463 RepID=A0A8J3CF12_9PSEU|nr:hypothetical protein GCM10012275_30250 [Longimycelium tulufanense]
MLESALDGVMTAHLGYERHDPSGKNRGQFAERLSGQDGASSGPSPVVEPTQRWSATETSSPSRPYAPPDPTTAGNTRVRVYQLARLLHYGLCGRYLESYWMYERPCYRCRHGYTSTHPHRRRSEKILCWREDHLLGKIRTLLMEREQAAVPSPRHLDTYLRNHQLVITCATGKVALTPRHTVERVTVNKSPGHRPGLVWQLRVRATKIAK